VLIDSHAHLDGFEDIIQVVQRARDNGVEKIIAVSSDLTSSKRTVEVASSFPTVFAAVGIHPHEASSFTAESFSEIEKLARVKKVVAIGETGLDYHYMNSPPDVQINSFREHVRLAKRLQIPVIVHVREAFDEVYQILEEERAEKSVIHCFTGNYEIAKKYIELGFHISFSGMVTFKNAEDVRGAAKNIPLEMALVETDSPYLAPIPFRGKKNEPAYVKYVAEKIAEVRGVSFREIAEKTTANAEKLFMLNQSEDLNPNNVPKPK
jgi:TatD DNase family protein